MKIRQRNTELFAPFVTATYNAIVDSEQEINFVIHRGITVEEITGASSHYEYTLTGLNLDGLKFHSQNPPNVFNLNDFPVLKRNSSSGSVEVYFRNSRGISKKHTLYSGNFGLPAFRRNVQSLTPGSYAEYSWNRMHEIFSQLDGPNMYIEGSYDRKHPTIIPHSELTGHAYHSYGWGNISSGPMWGRRPTAITKRHVVCAGHYTNNDIESGDQIAFKTLDNVIINRTVIGKFDPYPEMDLCIYLLDEDLPESIKPVLVAGSWAKNIISSNETTYVRCQQFYGCIVTNNYGHILPCQSIYTDDVTFVHTNASIGGLNIPGSSTAPGGWNPVTRIGFDEYNYNLGAKFNHLFIGGDSGSPIFLPVADGGWAMCGMVSGSFWNPSTMNLFINKCDEICEVSTGYTVTEAASPI